MIENPYEAPESRPEAPEETKQGCATVVIVFGCVFYAALLFLPLILMYIFGS